MEVVKAEVQVKSSELGQVVSICAKLRPYHVTYNCIVYYYSDNILDY